jgi:putative transferase (TIGR04331 family)
MRSRLLVTTALEETWRNDVPVLFLGEWCRLYARRARWEAIDGEVLPYHWDDRAKLHDDYDYLMGLYERLLPDLAAQLNGIHGTDHSVRYWRILVGPWLGYFTQILFDRWTSITQAAERADVSETIVLTGGAGATIPSDMLDFVESFVEDRWNHYLYGDILRSVPSVSVVETVETQPAVRRTSVFARRRLKERLRSRVADSGAAFAGLFTTDEDAFLLNTYLPLAGEMRLGLRLGQVPQRWRTVAPVRVQPDLARRAWQVGRESRSAFETCARTLIARHIPTVYLEGYLQLLRQVESLPWPRRPGAVLTASSQNHDDVFKVWAAAKVEAGAPLVLCQYGGHFGVGRWSFVEDHDLAICDRYLSWGWSDPAKPKVVPVGQIKARRPLSIRHAEQPAALLVTGVMPRYSYFLYSIMVARQWLDYFDDQCRFVAALPEPVRRALIVRLHPQDLGWSQAARWRDRMPDVQLDEGRTKIDDLIRRSRLYISTYNATTFLESMAMDVPTIMYWNPGHWELRDSASDAFDMLKEAGVFHETPEAAARHVASIWSDVGAWWTSDSVKRAVDVFRDRYCRTSGDLLGQMEAAVRGAMSKAGRAKVAC